MAPRTSAAQAATQFKQRAFNQAQRRPRQNVAFFSMEYALNSRVRIYSGGLGVLAGDWMKSAADIGAPLFPVGLLYRDGYFTQSIVGGHQQQAPQKDWLHRGTGIVDLQSAVEMTIAGQKVTAKLWGMEISGVGGEYVPLILLDTRGVPNPHGFDTITSQLYLFGLPIAYYHLNEGHAAFATVEILNRLGKAYESLTAEDIKGVREMFSFTTHTPVAAGFDRFSLEMVQSALSDPFLRNAVLNYGKDPLNQSFINMALLAMRLSGIRNGVSQLHAQVSEAMFPEFRPIIGITNGVHHLTWTSPETQELLDQHAPGWRRDPASLAELLTKGEDPEFRQALWETHQTNKKQLFKMVRKLTEVSLDPEVFTIGFARRFATYKRGDLLFTNEAELKRLAGEHGGLQIVMSGKAHPADGPGKGIIAHCIEAGNRLARETGGRIKFVFVPDYDMAKALLLVSGVDVWLNNPLRPYEASGTSGMKAALNGVPNVSISDGWWVENRGGGWTIGDPNLRPHDRDPHLYLADSASLYCELDKAIGAYRGRDTDPVFIDRMIESIARNGTFFNTQRMTEEYLTRVWVPGTNDPVVTPSPETQKRVELKDAARIFAQVTLAIGAAPTETEIEELAANFTLKVLSGSRRVTRYDAHNESVRVARAWLSQRFGEAVYEEHRSEMGTSGFDHWKALETFSGEVMADLLRSKTAQVVAKPADDQRCYREGKLATVEPFILVPEIVNGELRGAYKIDFHDDTLSDGEQNLALIGGLMEAVGLAKASRQAEAMRADFAELVSAADVVNWALTLMTAGGFTDMPRYAAETNRAALFFPDQEGRLIGRLAIGETGKEERDKKLVKIAEDVHREGVSAHLRRLDQSGSRLDQAVKGKAIGPNIIYGEIKVQDGITLFDHKEFNGGFDTVKLRDLRGEIEQLFTVDGRRIDNYLLIPVKGESGKPEGMVYVDNAFTGKPLSAAKYQAIIRAASQRLAEIQKTAKAPAK